MKRVRERPPLVVLPVFLALVLALLAIPLSAQNQAVVPDIGFEIEGNTALDSGGDYDWETVERPPGILIQDPNSKAETDLSTFRPNSKFDSPETWSIVPGQVGPSQNELTNILSWAILPGELGDDRPNDFWLVLGMERTKQEGTFDLDFEFNQIYWDGSSGGPERTAGDLVVGFELKGNPTDKEKDLQVLILQFDPDEQPELCDVTPGIPNEPALVTVGTDPCPPYGDSGWWYRFLADGAILADSGLGQATMNEEPFSVPEWWPSTDDQGNPRDEIGPFQFAEAAINLTDLGVEASCSTFSSVHAKSRSSLEVESDLKDLAGPAPVAVNCRLDGYKFLDLNGNGSWESDEPGLPDWEIRLDDGSVTYTNEEGYYEFNYLADGSYTVYEVCPDDWLQTAPGYANFDGCGSEVHTAELSLDQREVNDLNFGDAMPKLEVAKSCTGDVFWGDDIEYQVTVSNTGNVPLLGVVVEDPLTGLAENVDLAIGESRIFTGTYSSLNAQSDSFGKTHVLFLPLLMRGIDSSTVRPQPPVRPAAFTAPGTVTNTVTVTTEFGQLAVEEADSCTTTVHGLEVNKDVQASLRRLYQWTIDKTVDNLGPIGLYPGDFVSLEYAVTVDLDDPPLAEGGWAVEGTITVNNPAPLDATLASVTDMVSPDIAATVDCPTLAIPSGSSLTCTYGPVLLPDGSARTNTATATLLNNNGQTTDFSTVVDVEFTGASTEESDTEVEVSDSFLGYLGTVRYDEVPVTYTYSRNFTATGEICDVYTVDNEATFLTNDTGTTGSDEVSVDILELCTVSMAYEDLPTNLGNDWDYNDAVIDVAPLFLDVSANHDLLAVRFTMSQELGAGPTGGMSGFHHTFSLRPYPNAFSCDGSYTLEVTTNGSTSTSTGAYTRGRSFVIIPDTADPPDLVELTINFDPPSGGGCPFDLAGFDPVSTYHGQWLFFDPWLYVINTQEEIHVIRTGQGEARILSVPSDWQWPTPDGYPIWNAYPKVNPPDPARPQAGPRFIRYWWR
jgi:hypothetical protein